jgi:hypothetical protein
MDGIWYVHGHNGCQIQGRGIPISGKPPWKFPEFPGIPNASPGIPGIRLELETGVTVAFSEISPTSEPTVYWPLTAQ